MFGSQRGFGIHGQSRNAEVFELSIVVPTRDEVSSLEAVLEELHTVVIGSGFSTEVIVVDDASRDGTLDLAKRLAVELPLLHLTVLETATQRWLRHPSALRNGIRKRSLRDRAGG